MAPTPAWMTRTRTSSLLSLTRAGLDGLCGALDVGLDDEVQLLHLALLHLGEEVVQGDLLVQLVEVVLDLLLALLDQLTGHALVGHGGEARRPGPGPRRGR